MSVGDIIVIAVIVVLMALSIRALIKAKKNGGCCGNCSSCGCGCSSSCNQPSKPVSPHK